MQYNQENFPSVNIYNIHEISAYFYKRAKYQREIKFWNHVRNIMCKLFLIYIFPQIRGYITRLEAKLYRLEEDAIERFEKYKPDEKIWIEWRYFEQSLLRLNFSKFSFISILNFDWEDITQNVITIKNSSCNNIVKIVAGRNENYGSIYFTPHGMNNSFIENISMSILQYPRQYKKKPKNAINWSYDNLTEIYTVIIYELCIRSTSSPISIETFDKESIENIANSFKDYKKAYLNLKNNSYGY